MDEGNVRPHAGQQGDGAVHRVGLTRHCIASGLVQLPFALRDTLPEGEILALDVERDEAVVLEVVPPRGLAGLAEFFAAHDLQVNDRLEIRVRGHDVGEVRLAAVRSARRPTRDEDRGADERGESSGRDPSEPDRRPSGSRTHDDAASADSRPGPTPLPDTSVQDALDHGGWSSVRSPAGGPDVVETIGSVTVRRLGAGRFAASAVTAIAQPATDLDPDAPSARDARLGVGSRTAVDAVADTDTVETFETREPFDANEKRAAESFPESVAEPAPPPSERGRRDAPVRPEPRERRAPTEPTEPSNVRGRAQEPSDAELDALLVVDDARTPTPSSTPSSTPNATSSGRVWAPTIDVAPARQPSLFAPRNAERSPTVAPARPRSAPEASPPGPRPRPAAVQLNVSDLADPEVDATVRQRAREEELSRAGDLRSRIVRWLLAPATPVIVPIERVQHEFDLPVDVAREVVDGVLEEPPPTLRLTRLREDLLRVSRVTVEPDD